MADGMSLLPGSGTMVLAAACYLAAMLMAGLLTAFHRVSALHQNGLLEEDVYVDGGPAKSLGLV